MKTTSKTRRRIENKTKDAKVELKEKKDETTKGRATESKITKILMALLQTGCDFWSYLIRRLIKAGNMLLSLNFLILENFCHLYVKCRSFVNLIYSCILQLENTVNIQLTVNIKVIKVDRLFLTTLSYPIISQLKNEYSHLSGL